MVATATSGMLSQHITNEAMSLTRRPSPLAITKDKAMALKDRRDNFIRSRSLDRLRQFPAYLCTQGSIAFPNVLLFLNGALNVVQSAIKNFVLAVKRNSLQLAVFAALIVLLAQIVICTFIVFVGSKPPGLVFMLASLLLMAAIANRTFCSDCPTKRKSRRS